MFCLYCGHELPENAVFCNQCGRKQNSALHLASSSNAISSSTTSATTFMKDEQTANRDTPLEQVAPVSSNLPLPQHQVASQPLHGASHEYLPANQLAQLTPALLAFTSKRSIGPIIALIASILALLAFFFMPYVSITFGILGTYTLTGQQLASYGAQATNSPFSNQLSGLQLLWLAPLIAVIIIGFAGYILYKNTQMDFDEPSSKRAAIGLIIVAAIALVVLFIRYAIDAQPPVGSSYGYSGPTLASFYSSGFWVYVLSMIAVLAGGIVQLRASIGDE